MKLKKLCAFAVSAALCLSLCGCDLFTVDTDELLSPPQLSGDMYPIGKALAESAGSSYVLKYPTAGRRRSAIVMEDINGDGTLEAFAFYSTADGETATMHVNVIRYIAGKWISSAEAAITAGGVERVDFCDLDDDGVQEILIGWEIYGSSEKQLCVYTLTEDSLSLRFQQQYTTFTCCDLDEDGHFEIFLQYLNTVDAVNSAMLYSFSESGVEQTTGCFMDPSVKSVADPVTADLSSGKAAVYIDEVKGAGAVTEVLFLNQGELVNPLLNTSATAENTATLRSAALSCTDINDDGVIEIPTASDLPSADGAEKLYYTNWCSFNGENLTVKAVTLTNTADGYYLFIPGRLVGNISALRDSDRHRRVIYDYDRKTGLTGNIIAAVSAIDASDWDDKDYDRKTMFEIYRTKQTVYAGSVYEDAVGSVTREELKSMFKIIE